MATSWGYTLNYFSLFIILWDNVSASIQLSCSVRVFLCSLVSTAPISL